MGHAGRAHCVDGLCPGVLLGRAAGWPPVRPPGVWQGLEGHPDPIPRDREERVSQAPKLAAPSPCPRPAAWREHVLASSSSHPSFQVSPGSVLHIQLDPCCTSSWQEHFEALRFEQISVG